MSKSFDNDDSSGDNEEFFDKFIEELIKALGGLRRFEMEELSDDLFTNPDEVDEINNTFLDVRRPASLEELMSLMNSEDDANLQRQTNDAKDKRIMAAFYVLSGMGIVASAVTGNVAILAVILLFFLKLFRTR